MTFDVIFNIAFCVKDTTLYSKYDQASDLWQQLEFAFELESNLRDTVDWGREWLIDFNALGNKLTMLINAVLLIYSFCSCSYL